MSNFNLITYWSTPLKLSLSLSSEPIISKDFLIYPFTEIKLNNDVINFQYFDRSVPLFKWQAASVKWKKLISGLEFPDCFTDNEY